MRKRSKRARSPDIEAEQNAAAKMLHDMVGGPRTKKKRYPGPSKRTILNWVAEFQSLKSTGDFDDMQSRHLVAFYIIAHTRIYDVAPSEVVGKVAQGANSACKRMMREEFDEDPVLMLKYMAHIFDKETETEKWRRDNNSPGARLSFRDMFVWRRKLDDYRVDMARKGG